MNKTITALIIGLMLTLFLVGCQMEGADPPLRNIGRPYISVQPESRSFRYNQWTTNDTLDFSVEVWDWNGADGSLSYQWYTFTDIEEYCAAKIDGDFSDLRIAGATAAEYTSAPGEIYSNTSGVRFYYFAIVTVTKNDAADEKLLTLQSDIAAIAFNGNSSPHVPVINRNPADISYRWGAPMNPLRVIATASLDNGGGLLRYQWYTSDTYSIAEEHSRRIPDETQAQFMPSLASLHLGENYFFVKVTNGSSEAISIPAIITITPGIRAAAPRINKQPKDQLFFIDDVIEPLTVTAESLDLGDLSYQWYSATRAYNNTTTVRTNVTLIEDATEASFTPDINMAQAGSFFYYVVVTNTNENVTGTKTATVMSKAVNVRVGAAAGATTPNSRFTIPDPTLAENRYQYIRGYGGMDVAWGNFPETYPRDTELMYDPDRLGYNILRIMIKPNYVDIDQTMAELIATDRPNYYENVKIVNKYGGYVAASPWTPPRVWKSNNSVNGGGNLIHSYYRLYANYLRSFAQHMYDRGAPIYCISISNEPNYVAGYDGCEWEPEEMRDFYKEVGHFTDGIRGYGGGKEIPYVLTMNGESANTPNINIAALNDPVSKEAINLLARHIYGERMTSLYNTVPNLLQKEDGTMLEVWMTEHNINSSNAQGYYDDSTWDFAWKFMNDIDLVIRMNNENAFVWWASKRFYSMVGDGQSGTDDGDPLPRGWGLAHYSRYSIDTTRIKVDMEDGSTFQGGAAILYNRGDGNVNRNVDNLDNTSPRITAFVHPPYAATIADVEWISLVLWTPTDKGSGGSNMGIMEFAFPDGFTANSVMAHRSTGSGTSAFQVDDTILLNEERTKAYISLPRSQMLSVKFSR